MTNTLTFRGPIVGDQSRLTFFELNGLMVRLLCGQKFFVEQPHRLRCHLLVDQLLNSSGVIEKTVVTAAMKAILLAGEEYYESWISHPTCKIKVGIYYECNFCHLLI